MALGIGMVIFSVALSAVFNPALATAIGVGAIIYIGVYTIWLKPRSILNIVIGGAAGSMAVISGGAASHAWNSAGVLSLALLVFIWTPTHFWSLAMAYRNDYASAGFPMLPVKSVNEAGSYVDRNSYTNYRFCSSHVGIRSISWNILFYSSCCNYNSTYQVNHFINKNTGRKKSLQPVQIFKYLSCIGSNHYYNSATIPLKSIWTEKNKYKI